MTSSCNGFSTMYNLVTSLKWELWTPKDKWLEYNPLKMTWTFPTTDRLFNLLTLSTQRAYTCHNTHQTDTALYQDLGISTILSHHDVCWYLGTKETWHPHISVDFGLSCHQSKQGVVKGNNLLQCLLQWYLYYTIYAIWTFYVTYGYRFLLCGNIILIRRLSSIKD